jgi:hypothetical protein
MSEAEYNITGYAMRGSAVLNGIEDVKHSRRCYTYSSTLVGAWYLVCAQARSRAGAAHTIAVADVYTAEVRVCTKCLCAPATRCTYQIRTAL